MDISQVKKEDNSMKDWNKKKNYFPFLKSIYIITILLILFIYKKMIPSNIDNLIRKETKYKIRAMEELNDKNEILLTINKTINTSIINPSFKSLISEIRVNGIVQTEINVNLNNLIELEYEIHNITIKFKERLNSCARIFKDLDNIISIDMLNLICHQLHLCMNLFMVVIH